MLINLHDLLHGLTIPSKHSSIVGMIYKCFVFIGIVPLSLKKKYRLFEKSIIQPRLFQRNCQLQKNKYVPMRLQTI